MAQQLIYCPVRQHARISPDSLAIKCSQRTLSYQQLDQQLQDLSAQLATLGLTAGDRLICIAPNSLQLVLLQLCCMRSAIIFCPINPRFSAPEIALRVELLGSSFIWHQQTNADLPYPNLALQFAAPEKQALPGPPLAINPQRVIDIIFTSGSSGTPKAVMHNFTNHFYSAKGSQTLLPLALGDNNLLSLPLFHISGYATVFRTLLAGASLVLSEQKITAELLAEQQITHLSLVATQLYRLLEQPQFNQAQLPVKHLLLGGSAFAEQLLNTTRARGFNYHLSYGLTEMSSQVATSCNNCNLSILPERQVKIVNGEILLRGKTRFVGYFNKHQKNSVIPPQQWFASKDIGKKNGNQLQIIGRKDRQFICAGENIQPEEIETCLIAIPEIKQAYVVAVEHPLWGQQPVAFIDWQQQALPSDTLNNCLRSQLAAFKCPSHYFPLPPQIGLKVSLAQLKQQAQIYCQQLSAEQSPPP